MFHAVQRFARSPLGRRVLIWLAPIVFGWIMQQFSGKKGQTSRKTTRNKAR